MRRPEGERTWCAVGLGLALAAVLVFGCSEDGGSRGGAPYVAAGSGAGAFALPAASPEVSGPVAPAEPPAPPPPALVRSAAEVRKGEPLAVTVRRLDLEPADRERVVQALTREVDARRILPGERVEIARAPDGALVEATLVRDRLHRVEARFDAGEEAAVRLVERAPDLRVRFVEGELSGSLYEGVLAAGGDDNLTMRYADLLAWQVDFLTEPRAGDRFRILVREEWLDGERLGFGKILAAEYEGRRAQARAVRWIDDEGALDWYDDDGHSVRRAFLKSPLEYRRISSRFSRARPHPILKTVRPHWGVDYAAPRGTPVSALGDGVVTFAGRKGGYGNYVEIRHNATFTTCYGHLARFGKGVRSGVRVTQGQVIGTVGSTGLSTGPHLDFRVKRNGEFVDPLRLESPPGRSLDGERLESYAAHRDRVWRLAELLVPGTSVPEDEAWRLGPVRRPRQEVASLVP